MSCIGSDRFAFLWYYLLQQTVCRCLNLPLGSVDLQVWFAKRCHKLCSVATIFYHQWGCLNDDIADDVIGVSAAVLEKVSHHTLVISSEIMHVKRLKGLSLINYGLKVVDDAWKFPVLCRNDSINQTECWWLYSINVSTQVKSPSVNCLGVNPHRECPRHRCRWLVMIIAYLISVTLMNVASEGNPWIVWAYISQLLLTNDVLNYLGWH